MIKFNDKPELSFTFRNLKRTQFKTLSLDQNSDILHPNQFDSALVEEIPVVITVNDISHAVMMMTPCNLESFVIGFAFSEQLIDSVNVSFYLKNREKSILVLRVVVYVVLSPWRRLFLI